MTIDINNHEQILADVKAKIAASLPTEADKLAAADKFLSVLKSGEGQQRSYEQMKKLADDMRETRTAFTDVGSTLVGFDAEKFKDDNGKVVQLGPEWKPIIKEYDDALQRLLEQATSANTVMKSINSVFEAVSEDDGPDLKGELQNTSNIVEKKKTDDPFPVLVEHVEAFRKHLFVGVGSATRDLSAQRKHKADELADAKKNLKIVDDLIRLIIGEGAGHITAGASGVLYGICEVDPLTISTAIESAMALPELDSLLKQLLELHQKISQQIKDLQTSIAKIDVRIAEITAKYTATTNHATDLVTSAASQTSVISNIWPQLAQDMKDLLKAVDDDVGSGGKLSKLLLKRLEITSYIYKSIIGLNEVFIERSRASNV